MRLDNDYHAPTVPARTPLLGLRTLSISTESMTSMWSRPTKSPNTRVRLMVVAIGWVVIGAIGACGSGSMFVPAWQAAHGGGVTGTFTLTEPLSCDRYQPPRQRCGWFGDFRNDDGKNVRRHVELAEGLPPNAQVGDTVPARDTGSLTAVYKVDDRQGWRSSAGFFAAFSVALLLGILVLQPWSWRDRFKRARATGQWRRIAEPLTRQPETKRPE